MYYAHRLLMLPVCLLILAMTCTQSKAQSGPYPPTIEAWDAATKQAQRDAGDKLLKDVDAAIKRGDKRITVPKGDYRFDKLLKGPRPIYIVWRDMDGVTIDLQGSTLWFESPSTGIALANNNKCTLKNVNLDWDPLPFVQGTITQVDPKTQTFQVKIEDGYDQPINELTKNPNGWSGILFDVKTRQIKHKAVGFAMSIPWDKRTDDGQLIVKFNGYYGVKLQDSGFAPGDLIAMYHRMGRSMLIENCHDNTLENVTNFASPFVCFAQNYGKGVSTFRNVNILRRPDTDRLIASNADGINVANMAVGPVLDGCRIEYIGDDFVNVHSAYNRIVWQNSPTELVSSLINGYAAKEANEGKPVEVVFFDRKTMKVIGTRHMIKASSNNSYPVDQTNCLFDLKDYFHSGNAAQFKAGAKTARATLITLDKPIEITDDVVTTMPNFISAGAVIRNCYFVGSLARGIRLQAPEALIENNHIENTMGYGISMGGQPGFWGEGPYVHSTIVRNNTLIDCAVGSVIRNNPAINIVQGGDYTQSFTQYDITLEGNTIKGCGTMGIVARGIKDLKITGNTIEGYYRYEDAKQQKPMPEAINGTGYGMVIESCENVTLKNNTFSQPGPFAKGETFKARNK
jgi:hypothetical protein